MLATTAPNDRALTVPRLVIALAVIVALALVLPYGAVRTLHGRRLRAADENVNLIAGRLHAVTAGQGAQLPAGTEVLAGPGDRPVAIDERWNSATSIPLARIDSGSAALRPDPWGNAYLVNIAALRMGGAVWVLSAGPDGIVQTPFGSSDGPLGDDRAARVR